MKQGPRRSVELERQWRERIEEQSASGLSVRVFCQAWGIAEPSFYQWRRELARRDRHESTQPPIVASSRASSATDFIPVSVLVSGDDGRVRTDEVTIEVGGATIRVRGSVEEETLRRVVRVLRQEAMGSGETSPC